MPYQPLYQALLAQLDAERKRADDFAAQTSAIASSRTMKVLGALHRLTKRGIDPASLVAPQAIRDPSPTADDISRAIIQDFACEYYNRGVWQRTTWLGHAVQKFPTDLMLYQELIFRTKPDVVIETGTLYGGSAWFLGGLLDLIGHGRVISVDSLEQPGRPEHPRVTYHTGSSTDAATVSWLESQLVPGERVMLILDSDHRESHVYSELVALHHLVSEGCHLIVEDTCINGNPVRPDYGPGPGEALRRFLEDNHDFEPEPDADKYLHTQNPGGVLVRRSRG